MSTRINSTPSSLGDFPADAPRVGTRAESRIAFRVAPQAPWLVLATGIVLELAPDSSRCRIPNAPAWFCGLINLRGQLFPIFDLASWAGYEVEDRCQRAPILIGRGAHAAAMLCFGEPNVVQWAPSQTPDLTLPQRLRDFVHASAQTKDGAKYVLFDHEQWFAAAGRKRSRPASATPRN